MNIAIYGYGNLGKGVECALSQSKDQNLVGIFTRRNPSSISTLTGVSVYSADDIYRYKEKIDVVIICGGSATDLPFMTPALAKDFNVVDSFDTHAKIPEHFNTVNESAKEGNHVAVISGGWDPGLFSINRLYASSILESGDNYTFWGRGVSQGHSDAIRRIPGVKDARQYTVPIEESIKAVKDGECPVLSTRQKHCRECYVVAEPDADKEFITKTIVTMPNYFSDYDTTVTFITEEEMQREHNQLPHGGCVIRTGKTGIKGEHKQIIEYNLKLDSNPEFTGCVLAALSRAAFRLYNECQFGCKTVFDIPPAYYSSLSSEELRKTML